MKRALGMKRALSVSLGFLFTSLVIFTWLALEPRAAPTTVHAEVLGPTPLEPANYMFNVETTDGGWNRIICNRMVVEERDIVSGTPGGASGVITWRCVRKCSDRVCTCSAASGPCTSETDCEGHVRVFTVDGAPPTSVKCWPDVDVYTWESRR